MKDRVVQFPSRYQLVPVSGTTDTYDLVAVPGIVTEPGTNLNKANLLADAVATLYGLSASAVINDVLNAIGGVPIPLLKGGTGATTADGVCSVLSAARIAIGSYTGTGNFGSGSPCTLACSFAPKLLILPYNTWSASTNNYTNGFGIALKNATYSGATSFFYILGPSTYPGNFGTFTWGTSTVSWYDSSALRQANVLGTAYPYLLLG